MLSPCRGYTVNLGIVIIFIVFASIHYHIQPAIHEVSWQLPNYFNNRSKSVVVSAAPESCTTTLVEISCPTVTPTAIPNPTIQPFAAASAHPSLEQATVAQLREQGIVVVFKTGAQEVSQLGIHLGTTLRYFGPDEILFFSDLQSTIGPFTVNDALKHVDEEIRMHHKDFDIYHALRRYQSTGQDVLELKEAKAKGDDREGWRLDKYKFIHMVEQTFEMRPSAKWYVFIETDSYVVWPNLIQVCTGRDVPWRAVLTLDQWLQRYDATKPWYLGSVVFLGSQAFAHGGSGYVLSHAAMNRLLGPEQPQGLAASWDKKMDQECTLHGPTAIDTDKSQAVAMLL